MKAIEINPDSPEAWSILADITLSMGKLEDSQVFAERSLQIKNDDLMNLLTMCEVKLKMKDFESHIVYCNKVMKSLGLERNKTVDDFNDLKNLFVEIDNSVEKNAIYSSRINNIITELDSYIIPVAN